jgi:DNA uptake protein ComE-like DNA-binding protein
MQRIALLVVVVMMLVVALPAAAQVGTNGGVLNPNIAGEAEMAALPHIDATIARALVDGRPYLSALQLDAALREAGLDEAQRAEVYVRLFVPVNLVSASREELLLIPGTGPRMAHEFEEYRPWDGGMVRFRREIRKYVDDEEVARFEQYVFVPMDLNTATREDFLTIPGMGERMVGEFFEYRPYVNMEQFRREIGKYVDDHEVARLARYVYVK